MDNGFKALTLYNKMQSYPPLTIAGSSTGRNWCAWKQSFLSFLQKEDDKELYKDQWTVIFLMLVGSLGEEAYKNLSANAQNTRDLETLFRELDIYFIFGSEKKQNSEDIETYIDRLMFLAIGSNHSDPVNIVKHKVVEDIKNCAFAKKAIPSTSQVTDVMSYLHSLDFCQIKLFWERCENEQKQFLFSTQSAEMVCVRCGTFHGRNRCPAHGVQCNNCKGHNHFTANCKVKYISNCIKCGTHHVQSRCPAFGKQCEKCGKLNHYSRLCQIPIVKNCTRCGMDHAISMCPAQGCVCSKCKKPNHFKEKCLTK
ncbi:hypothetical protein PUN28_008334 [Cardiocondyla obscurior]|uniref:CCHC-type domain-containing protein n=1 Tax=Cardiocondyla obscurior TaxID=286306 RepID=A0AAW2FX53_9HYME